MPFSQRDNETDSETMRTNFIEAMLTLSTTRPKGLVERHERSRTRILIPLILIHARSYPYTLSTSVERTGRALNLALARTVSQKARRVNVNRRSRGASRKEGVVREEGKWAARGRVIGFNLFNAS